MSLFSRVEVRVCAVTDVASIFDVLDAPCRHSRTHDYDLHVVDLIRYLVDATRPRVPSRARLVLITAPDKSVYKVSTSLCTTLYMYCCVQHVILVVLKY